MVTQDSTMVRNLTATRRSYQYRIQDIHVILYQILGFREPSLVKRSQGTQGIVIFRDCQLLLISTAHNDGHHGFFMTNALISERYWWPLCPKTSPGSFLLAICVRPIK